MIQALKQTARRLIKHIVPVTILFLLTTLGLLIAGSTLWYLMVTVVEHISLILDIIVILSGIVVSVTIYAIARMMTMNLYNRWRD